MKVAFRNVTLIELTEDYASTKLTTMPLDADMARKLLMVKFFGLLFPHL